MSDRLLRLSLFALPRDLRRRDGAVMLDCARELVDGGGRASAEAAGIVAAGLRARVTAAAGPAASAPWRAALDRLAVPLAVAALVVFAAGAGQAAYTGRWWPAVLVAGAAALLGAAFRWRGLALAGWSVLLAADLYAVLGQELTQTAGRFSAPVGSLSVDVPAAVLPMLALGLATAFALRPGGPRRAVGALATTAAAGALALFAADATAAPWREYDVLTAVLAVILIAPLAVTIRAIGNRRPEALACAALLLAAAAPELVWLSTGLMPYPGPAGALAVLAGGGALATLAVLRLSRFAGVRAR